MNRSAGNPNASLWLLLCALLWTQSALAELSATVDRREIAMGETLRLTLLGDAGEQPAEIDLTPLSRDWEILSRSSATNARFINGQNQVTRTLEMELAPLREGTLSIPSLPLAAATRRRCRFASIPSRWSHREMPLCCSKPVLKAIASMFRPRPF